MIQLQLNGHEHDLGGGFVVRRMLPSAARQSVGPFLFFDHFGPVTVEPSSNFDVRPHPHIGLATVTYLFDGAIMHRDSLGSAQRIEPGAINWMTAGRGIVHSERRPDDLAGRSYVNHGVQLWAGLPRAHQQTAPEFHHTPAAAIPSHAGAGFELRVLIGSFEIDGQILQSPVRTFSETLYLDVLAQPGAAITLPPRAPVARPDGSSPVLERAVYAVDHALTIDGTVVPPRSLAVLEDGAPVRIEAPEGGRVLVIGGEALDGHRLMWWNFVSTDRALISDAADAWERKALGDVAGDAEFIPLPPRKF